MLHCLEVITAKNYDWSMQIQIFDNSLEKFIEGLEKATIAKVLRTIDLFEKFGRDLKFPHTKGISDGLFELRVRGKQEIRIFYTFYRAQIILLHGFIKKSQKTPHREIRAALEKLKRLD